MRIRVTTDSAAFGHAMLESLDTGDHDTDVDVVDEGALAEPEIRVRPDLDFSILDHLINSVSPFVPKITTADDPDAPDADIRLGERRPLSAWDLRIMTHDAELCETVRGPLLEMGFEDGGTDSDHQGVDQLDYGGASAFARQVVRWQLAKLGIRVTENKVWGDGDNDIWVRLSGAAVEAAEPGQTGELEINIHGDDLRGMFELQKRLHEAGFDAVSLRPVDRHGERALTFSFRPGRIARDEETTGRIQEVISSFLSSQDVDPARFPLKIARENGPVRIMLPLGAHRSGALRPYVGDTPDRWDVALRTDAPSEVADLAEQLRGEGYTVRIESLPARCLGFRLGIGAAAEFPARVDAFRTRANALISSLSLSGRTALQFDSSLGADDPRIELDLPIRLFREGRIEDLLREFAADWECSLKAPSGSYDDLATLLSEMGFKSYNFDPSSVTSPEIKYGGAPRALVEHIADLIFARTGHRCAISKPWGDSDDDIWIYLPPEGNRPTEAASEDNQVEEIDLSAWFTRTDTAANALLEIGADTVRIGELVLPRRSLRDEASRKLVPPPAMFEHYCLDQRTAETLLHVAEGVMLREPVLLEGETSVSKTSIIQLLAMYLDQPLVRLNLNGQTDTGELVGRFLPRSTTGDLPVDAAEMLESADLLEPESRMILQRAREQDRPLNAVEIQQIMANERMHAHPWRWVDGLVISAMKHGWWVVLDELNLAEPQILERLNSVLERTPSIVLTEHDNAVFGSGGEPVHPDFRIFATMNPAEYAGRSALSPAYRDRWRGYRFIDPPSESDYHAMLRFLVSGEQPEVEVRGRRYAGANQPPAFGALQGVPDIDGFLVALARFHTALESAVRNPDEGRSAHFGVRRQERYIFTRRGLLAVMDYLVAATATSMDPIEGMRVALMRYYLGRVANAADRATVARLLDAAGIGLKTWSLGDR